MEGHAVKHFIFAVLVRVPSVPVRVKRSILAVLLLCLCLPVLAQTIPVPNAAFDALTPEGLPEGWTLTGGEGGLSDAAPQEGARGVWVRGTGATEDRNTWCSESIPFEAGGLYSLRFDARREDPKGAGGCAVSGTDFFNVDLSQLPAEWQPVRHVFAVPEEVSSGALRFGQWQDQGLIGFREPRLCRAMALHRPFGAVTLGADERIAGNTYTFTPALTARNTNFFRPTRGFTTGFNTNRILFGDKTFMVFEHHVAEHPITAAKLSFSNVHYGDAVFHVEAGRDGKTWTPLGDVAKDKPAPLTVPAALLPADSLWVRLSADSETGGSVQLHEYRFEAELAGEPMEVSGETLWFDVLKMDEGMTCAVEAPGLFDPAHAERGVALRLEKDGQPVKGMAALLRDGQPFSMGALGGMLLPCPGDAGRHELTLEADGARLALAHTVPDFYNSAYGELLDPDGVWWASSGWKIPRNRALPKAAGRALRIELAQNEAEAAQLVVCPDRAVAGFSLACTDLTGPNGAVIPAEQVSLLRVGYVPVTMPSDPTGVVAPWPDPLPPQAAPMTLAAGENQPFWVRVKTAPGTPAGEYRGKLLLNGDGCAKSVDLEVRVFGFTLPDRMTCTTAFGMNTEHPFNYHGAASGDDRRRVVDLYHRALSEHHISPYDLAPLDPFTVKWPDISPENPPADPDSLEVNIDWVRYDAAMARAFEEFHFNTFAVPIRGMGGGTFHSRHEPELLGFGKDSPVFQKLFTDYCQQVQGHLREKGWLKDGFVYWFDEPEPRDYEFVMDGFRRLKEAAPDIPRMLTEEIQPELLGGPNIWCPLTPALDMEAARARQAIGEVIWWYVCTGPRAPYATLFIDHPGTEMRVWLWQTWERGVQGLLVWETLLWTSPTAYPDPDAPQNPYLDPMGWAYSYGIQPGVRQPWGNGDGRFLYPPESAADGKPAGPVFDPPVDTIRIEMLRDGIEDYEYMALLRRALEEKGDRLAPAVKAEYEALLTVPAEITTSLTEFTKDPAPIEAHRRKVAGALEALGHE